MVESVSSFIMKIWMMVTMMILMMMLLMMILMMISILYYNISKIPKVSFKWILDLGTSPGHEPIIDQSYYGRAARKYYDIVVRHSREHEQSYHSSSRLLVRYVEKRLDY